jgi:hypothetical protein
MGKDLALWGWFDEGRSIGPITRFSAWSLLPHRYRCADVPVRLPPNKGSFPARNRDRIRILCRNRLRFRRLELRSVLPHYKCIDGLVLHLAMHHQIAPLRQRRLQHLFPLYRVAPRLRIRIRDPCIDVIPFLSQPIRHTSNAVFHQIPQRLARGGSVRSTHRYHQGTVRNFAHTHPMAQTRLPRSSNIPLQPGTVFSNSCAGS